MSQSPSPVRGRRGRIAAIALRAARKTLWMLLVLWGITLISFWVIHLAPGSPTDMETTLNPLAGNLLADVCYGLADPRIRASGEQN